MFEFHAGGTEDCPQRTRRAALFSDDFAQVAGRYAEPEHRGAGVVRHIHLNGFGFIDKGPGNLKHQGPHIRYGALLRLDFDCFSHSHTSRDVAARAPAYRYLFQGMGQVHLRVGAQAGALYLLSAQRLTTLNRSSGASLRRKTHTWCNSLGMGLCAPDAGNAVTLGSGCGFGRSRNRYFGEQTADGIGELRTFGVPVLNAIVLEIDGGGVGTRVVGPDDLDRTTVAGAILLDNNDAVLGLLAGAYARQANHQHWENLSGENLVGLPEGRASGSDDARARAETEHLSIAEMPGAVKRLMLCGEVCEGAGTVPPERSRGAEDVRRKCMLCPGTQRKVCSMFTTESSVRLRRLTTRGFLLFGCFVFGCSSAVPAQSSPERPPDPLHAWVGLQDGAGLDRWVQWHLGEERRLIHQVTAAGQGQRSVQNTLAAFDEAEMHLSLAGDQSGILFEVHPSKAVRDRAQELVQVISAENAKVSLNQEVYRALAAVDVSKADAATRHYVERTLLEYRLGGVDKDQATRDKVKKLEDRLTELSLQFSRNVQDDLRKVSVKNVAGLDGLPADYLERHKPGPDGTITLTTDSPDMSPVMTYAKDAGLRRAMFLAYNNRAYPANEPMLKSILETRQELATMLGFATWADLATADQMMGSAAKMRSFLNQVDEASRDRSKREFDKLQAFVRSQDPAGVPITASDAGYWNEQYRRSAYVFDSQSVRPYFAYATVESGVLKTASRLFHLEFRPSATSPVWDASVHAFDVYDGGQLAGRIYLDMHPREGKDKWFSEAQLVPGVRGGELPEAALVCNFSGGVAGEPGLMQFSEVVTFFHEFGHMMHEVLGGKQRWAGQSGVSTEGDFVEAPSQMLEEMFHDPTVLQSFARDYKTGGVMPTELIAQLNRASYFGRAGWVQGQLLYANYSLQVHDRSPDKVDLERFLREDTERFSPFVYVPGSHFYSSFTHLSGYSSNYYTYVLDKVIAVDFFTAFDPKNLLDGPAALRYRRTVLEPGSSKPADELVKDFLGRPQSIGALKSWMDREFDEPAAPRATSSQGSEH